VYVNGEYLPETEAKISVFDRGFLFADGVYEVSAVVAGKLVDSGIDADGEDLIGGWGGEIHDCFSLALSPAAYSGTT
jgi:hypothetical protein